MKLDNDKKYKKTISDLEKFISNDTGNANKGIKIKKLAGKTISMAKRISENDELKSTGEKVKNTTNKLKDKISNVDINKTTEIFANRISETSNKINEKASELSKSINKRKIADTNNNESNYTVEQKKHEKLRININFKNYAIGFFLIFVVIISLFMVFNRENKDNRVPEVETPIKENSFIKLDIPLDYYIGKQHSDVYEDFKKAGFTSIETVAVKDWDETSDFEKGSTTYITINGNDYESNKEYQITDNVIIAYHDMSEASEDSVEPEVLTVKNCPELPDFLNVKNPADPIVIDFNSKYNGKLIEFDGCITAFANHENYSTRFDILINTGDFNEYSVTGPNFKLTNVSWAELNSNEDDEFKLGTNIHAVVKLISFDKSKELYYIEPVSITCR